MGDYFGKIKDIRTFACVFNNYWIKIGFMYMAKRVFLFLMVAVLCYACTEEIDESARYVFKERTLMDYLNDHSDYDAYTTLLHQVPIGSLSDCSVAQILSARGHYTVFAPTNEAIHEYLETLVEKELLDSASWEAFTDSAKLDSIRKVIVYNSIIDSGDNDESYETSDFPQKSGGEFPLNNLMDKKLSVTWNANNAEELFINGVCPINIKNRDILATNGVLHQVEKVIAPTNNSATVYFQDILDKQEEGYLVYARAIQACGLFDTLDVIRDDVYEALYQAGKIPDLQGMTNHGFAEGDVGYAPAHRLIGFTIFAETDDFWKSQNIDPKDPDLLAKLQQWVLDNHQYSEEDKFTVDENYAHEGNLLYQWLTYHILPMKIPANKLVIHHSESGYNRWNKTLGAATCEYYASFGKRRLFKLYESAESHGVYINRFPVLDNSRKGTYHELSCAPEKTGCRVGNDDERMVTSDISNACIYPIDKPLSYNDEVRKNLGSERIRFDGMSLFPEAMTNDIRKKEAYDERYQHVHIPQTSVYPYFKDMIVNDDCNFVYYNAYDYNWCNLHADEMKAVGRYELTFTMPPVPRKGIYELRYVVLANNNRGIAQMYFGSDLNNLPVTGIPMDITMRATGNYSGGYRSTGFAEDTEDMDYNTEVDKRMRNLGYMKGCKLVCSNGDAANHERISNGSENVRHIVLRQMLDPDKTYYLKLKSVLDSDKKEFYMDYMEFCPKEVFDNPAEPEDIW